MGEFFRSWRTRVGIYSLLMASLFMMAWIWTFFINAEATFTINDRIHMVWSLQGGFIWLAYPAQGDMALRVDWGSAKSDSYGGVKRTQFAKDWKDHFERLGRPPRVWTAHYSALVIPLMLLSAWLLFSKPRQRKSANVQATETSN